MRIRKNETTSSKRRGKAIIISILIVLAVFGAIILIWMMKVQNQRAGVAGSGGPGASATLSAGSIPEIATAVIMPEQPRSDTRLIVQVTGRSPEDDPIKYRFRWYVDDSVVQEGENSVLEPGPFRKGDSVSAEVIPFNSKGAGKPYKTTPVIIGNIPPSVTSISLKPLPALPGDILTAVPVGKDVDGDSVTYSYQWFVNQKPVEDLSPDSSTFNTKGLRKKDDICVIVIPSDGESKGPQQLSDLLLLSNTPPRITSLPPDGLENGVYSYHATAIDADGDALTFSLITAPSGMTIDAATGMIQWTPPSDVVEGREISVKIRVDDGDGGSATQDYSFVLDRR